MGLQSNYSNALILCSVRNWAYRGVPAKILLAAAGLFSAASTTVAQTAVTTQHYDISRTGANTNETILTPSNVNTSSFGKLFSQPVDGYVYAQPLYLPGVTMGAGTPQAGTVHNVVFVATEHDSVYAFDADSSSGANANPLWHVSLIDTAHGGGTGVNTEKPVPNTDVRNGDIVPEIGITSTPVIDPSTNTLYVVAKSTVSDVTFIQRLHALDITTGLEKFGGPSQLSASVPGNGNGSSGGILNWDPLWQSNRAGLLLLNGIIYIGFGSHGDLGPWHGWILAYNAATLKQTGVWCSTPNSAAGGTWLGGTGLAADVPAGKPYGRMFTATGNGTFDATAPNYSNAMDYGDSIIKLDLNNGVPTMIANGTTVGDDFTPYNQAVLNNTDADVASGGVVLLPDSVGGGNGQHQLVQVGKSGWVYVVNRENLGGYNPNNTSDPQQAAKVEGVWGSLSYWNGNVYIWSVNNYLMGFSFANGVLSSNPTSTSVETAGQYSPSPIVSANGNTNGIVWSLKTDNYPTQGRAVLYAHNATNVANLLYSSESNVPRDNPGNSVKFVVPTVINGKVYVGTEALLSVYGLLSGSTQAATPSISPASKSFTGSLQVTISDTTTGATIYYTTDGSTPTTASTQYTSPFNVTTTTTVNAIAAGTGLLASPVASVTYTLQSQVSIPTFNPPPGYYTAAQSVTISTTTSNCTIYYTLDGTTPTKNSTKYTGPVSVGVTETLSAIAVDNSGVLSNSPVASGLYTIDISGGSSINLGAGFTPGSMELLGSAKLNGSALQLTDGGGMEAAAAWYQFQVNVQSFTTAFKFQITPASTSTADGFTFTIQGNNASAIGPPGGGLGYGPQSTTGTPGIASSVAVKFDLASNQGEGNDSTGLYTNGAAPTIPAVDMTSSGVNLHSGDVFQVQMSYDGTTLTMTITDTVTNAKFTTSWAVNIPSIVGGNGAYVGFTAGTGAQTAVQQILNWTFASGSGPTISSLSPTSGQVGTPVTITGANFGSTQSTSTVTFNGVAATPTSWSATSIVVPVPSGATTGNVVVSIGGSPSNASNGVNFTVTPPPPAISSMSPTSGPVGTSVTITGTNIGGTQGTSTVTFNGTVGSPTSWSGTSIAVPVPAGATTGNVVVTVGGVASNGVSFTVSGSGSGPAITNLNPNSGVAGTAVTIAGTNFGSTQGSSTVTFNGTAATPTSWSATGIGAAVPAGATTGNVVVTVGGVASNGVGFTVNAICGETGQTGVDNQNGDWPFATPCVTGNDASSYTPVSIQHWIGAPASANFDLGIYADSSGFPGALLCHTGTTTITPTAGWNNLLLSGQGCPALSASTRYWIGYITDSNSIQQGQVSGVCPGTSLNSGYASTQLGSPLLTTPFGSFTGTPSCYSMYLVLSRNSTPPSISSVSPTSGTVGVSVTITGTNFGGTQGTSTVTFNGTAGSPTSWGATSIAVPVPAGATTGNVVVTVGGVASNGVNFTVVPTASISSVSPTSGAVGASVTITGTNFGGTQGTSTVTFNGTAGSPTSWGATSIAVPVPAGATTGNVVVTAGGVASNGVNFTVVPTVSISSVSPTSGGVGASVTITGTNFGSTQGSSTVTFNGTAGSPTSWSGTSIAVPVPAGATTGNVVVTVGGVASNGVSFTVTSICGETGQSGIDASNGNWAFETPCVTGSDAKGYTPGSIQYWVGNPTSATFDLGIYADNAGSPGSLLCHTGTTAITPASGWNSISLSGKGCPILSASTRYWIGYIVSSDGIQQGIVGGVCPGTALNSGYASLQQGSPVLPNPFGATSGTPSCYSMYLVLNNK